jgi:hypothetical protein
MLSVTSSATPTPTETQTPVHAGVVANTGGPAFTAWREGTRVILIAAPEMADGREWLRVRDESGIEGWVAADYVSIVP